MAYETPNLGMLVKGSDRFNNPIDILNQVDNMVITNTNKLDTIASDSSLAANNSSLLDSTIKDHASAIDLIERVTATNTSKVDELTASKNNHLRQLELNTYENKQYTAHSAIVRTFVVLACILLILTILTNQKIIPQSVSITIAAIVAIIGFFLLGYQVLDTSTRDNMVYDEYNWNFNPKNQKPTVIQHDMNELGFGGAGGVGLDGRAALAGMGCMGEDCCAEGLEYDTDARKCIIPGNASEQFSNNSSSEPASFEQYSAHGTF